MKFELKPFQELTTTELYSILRLRAEVFVVEQNCPYQDLDNRDQDAYHFLGFENRELLAYVRILKPETLYKEPSIGRVVTAKKARNKGMGKAVFKAALAETSRLFPNRTIKIMAQCYLEKFYQEFGFVAQGEEFLEDGIPHVEMVLLF